MKITKRAELKQKTPEDQLGFGKYFTDYMLTMEYENGQWNEPEIVPYAPFSLDPSAAVFHYGQAVFEGLKAYKTLDGAFNLFRVRDNIKRLNNSGNRMCIPEVDEDKVYNGLMELLKLERRWIPEKAGTSLYIRPSIIATQPSLSVHSSNKFLFFIILSPVGAYYTNGLAPVKLYVENEFVRACLGGTGHHKFSGNYAASLKAGESAEKKGYDQVLWLDAKEYRYVEEVGSMNIFFVKNNEIYTPALNGSILPGITRDSVIKILNDKGYAVKEDKIDINRIIDDIENGTLTESFGTGTAAVISPVGEIFYNDKIHTVNDFKMGKISRMLYDTITGIQTGRLSDKYNWVTKF